MKHYLRKLIRKLRHNAGSGHGSDPFGEAMRRAFYARPGSPL